MKKIVVISLFLINCSSSLLFAAATPKYKLTVHSEANQMGNQRMYESFYHNRDNKFFSAYKVLRGTKFKEGYFLGEDFYDFIHNAEKTLSSKEAIENGFLKFDNYISAEMQNNEQVTTAIIALIRKQTLYVANVGLHRAVLCTNGQAIQVSTDHHPDALQEKIRIENSGGSVTTLPYLHHHSYLETMNEKIKKPRHRAHVFERMNSNSASLTVSRALGKHTLEGIVIPNPDIHVRKLDGTEEFLIIGSDSLWDVMSNEAAVGFTKALLTRGCSIQECVGYLLDKACKLWLHDCAFYSVRKALDLWNHDNISVTLILFNKDSQ